MRIKITFIAPLTVLFLSVSPTKAFSGDWKRSWSSEQGAAAQRCAETFEDYQLQAICMENEQDGYQQMQGSFGLPGDVSNKAKSRCARTFNDFQLQAICMSNEADGYAKMKRY